MFKISGRRMLVLLGLLVMVTVTFAGTEGEKSHESIVGFTAWVQYTQEYNIGDPILFEGVNVNEDRLKLIKDTLSCTTTGAMNGGVVYGEAGIQHSTFTVFLVSAANSAWRHNDTVVGFTAYLTGDAIGYEPNEVIKFSGEIYNSGSYDPQTGYFTCPVTGVYYINTHLQRYGSGSDNLRVGVSLDSILVLHSDQLVHNHHANAISNSRFLQCSQGQTLSLKGLSHGYIHGGDTESKWTTFTVMYISQAADPCLAADTDTKHISFQGFTAFKPSDQTYDEGDNISFETILVNEGGHFDGEAFECPVTALYFVSVNLKKVGSQSIYLDVVQGSVIMFRSEESNTGHESNTVSNSGLFRCLQGELVQVRAFSSGSVHGDPVHTYTSFSVMLISQI